MKRKQLARIDLSNPDIPKVSFVNVEAFRSDLRDFKDSERVFVTIERYYRKRSLEQNSVLHWYLYEIAQETGMEMLEVKEQMAKKYLMVDVLDKDGNVRCDPETSEVMTRVRSTTELSTVEFNDYTEKIRMWANSYLNLQLPLPNETTELKFKNIE